MTDYNERYSANWSSVSAKVKRSQSPYEGNVKCACCGKIFPWQETETDRFGKDYYHAIDTSTMYAGGHHH